MAFYSNLLNKAIQSIKGEEESKAVQSMFDFGGFNNACWRHRWWFWTDFFSGDCRCLIYLRNTKMISMIKLKDFIPKSLKLPIRKRLTADLKQVKLVGQISGENTPSVINENAHCQVVQFYDTTVSDIKPHCLSPRPIKIRLSPSAFWESMMGWKKRIHWV